MTPEDRMLARFAAEKKSRVDTSAVFNLNGDEDELTHFGQSLSTLNYIDGDDPSMGDDETHGKDYTKDLHFGGFDKATGANGEKKSYQEIMQEVIAKSKFHRAERQKEKEETEVLRRGLNEEFDEIRGLLDSSKQSVEEYRRVKSENDDYDMFVREFAFEKRAKPTDRVKTEEELARDKAEKLIAMENERQKAMNAPVEREEYTPKSSHAQMSGDSLRDDFAASGDEEDEPEALHYRDGKLVNSERIFMRAAKPGDSGESEGEMSMNSGSEDEILSEDEDEDESQDESASGDEAVEEENASDPDELEEASEEEQEPAPIEPSVPFIVAMPETSSEFYAQFSSFDLQDQPVYIDRLLTLFHPSLSSENPQKMQTLLAFLVDSVCRECKPEDLNAVATVCFPTIIQLAYKYPEVAGKCMQSLVSELRITISKRIKERKRILVMPRDVMVMLMTCRMMATSDYSHSVVTPMFLLFGEVFCQLSYLIGAEKSVESPLENICAGLMLVHIFMDSQKISKRFMPELVFFLHKAVNVLDSLSSEHNKPSGNLRKLSFADIICTSMNAENLMAVVSETIILLAESLSVKEMHFKSTHQSSMKGVFLTLDTAEGGAWEQVFSPFIANSSLSGSLDDMKSKLLEIRERIGQDRKSRCDSLGAKATRPPMKWQKKVVQTISSVAPKFEAGYNMDRHAKSSVEHEESKLKYLHKREMKGAIRELRKDASFLASEKLKETRAKDQAYKTMIKKIYGAVGNEAGEAAKEDRPSKKRRK
eukprot:Partr_v1_DN28151_c2_g1_i5_m55145 putative Nucleolar protein